MTWLNQNPDRIVPLRRVGKIFLFSFAGVLVALIGFLIFIDTAPGHRFVISLIERQELENGIHFEIKGLDGSIYSELEIEGLTVHDPVGAFASVPNATLDWRPLKLLWSHLDIGRLEAEEMRWERMPELRETPPSDDPLLPDMDIDIDRLELGRIWIGEAVSGQEFLASLTSEVHIADGRAELRLDGGTQSAGNRDVVDRLAASIDAVPATNTLDLELDMQSPRNGLLSRLVGAEGGFSANLKGMGDWQSWNGQIQLQTDDNELAKLSLSARSGDFNVKGVASPAPLLSGFLARLLAEPVSIDLDASFNDRIVALDGAFASPIFDLKTSGLIDLGNNEFDGFLSNFGLHQPGVLASNISADNLTGEVTIDGPIAEFSAQYDVAAQSFAIGSTRLNRVRAKGTAEAAEDHFAIPFDIAAQNVSGLDPETNRQLREVSIIGELLISGDRLMANDVAITSAGVDARMTVLGDISKGSYLAKLNGKVTGYEIASLGRFDARASTDINVDENGFTLSGRAITKSRRINSAGVEGILGGATLTSADIGYDRNGTFKFSNLKMSAPKFRVSNGAGSYASNGALEAKAAAFSSDYGPLQIGASGTFNELKIQIAAKRPGLGLGITDLVANIQGSEGRYTILARGSSPYGDVSSDLLVDTTKPDLTIDVREGKLAEVVLKGLIRQEKSGPFSGLLKASGNGVTGTVRLSQTSGRQLAKISATADSARFPGSLGLSIDRAIIEAEMVLENQPDITADIQLSGASINQLRIGRGRAKLRYIRGSGEAEFFAEGRSGVDFNIVGNARLSPERWLISVIGNSESAEFRSIGNITVVPKADGYVINPSRLAVASGEVKFSGRLAKGSSISASLSDVDLSIIAPFYPSLGLGGRASGEVRWQQASAASFPAATARLAVSKFTRASVSGVSSPMDLAFTGKLDRDQSELKANLRNNGKSYGRLQVFVKPNRDLTRPWIDRLQSGPISGGFRFNGPADLLFSLAALPEQRLRGGVAVAADFSGLGKKPRLSGVVRSEDLSYFHDGFGTRLSKMRIRGTFVGDELRITELSAKAGSGSVSGKGLISLSSAKGYPLQLDLVLRNAQLADSRTIAAEADGSISVTANQSAGRIIKGTLLLPGTRYQISNSAAVGVAQLSGVRRKSRSTSSIANKGLPPIEGLPTGWKLDIGLVANDKLYVSGMGIESEWKADLKVTGTPDAPQMSGTVTLIRGTLGFAGRTFKISDGKITFGGGSTLDSVLSLRASSVVDGVTVVANVSGTGNKPSIRFTSNPGLPQDEIMARILFGSSVGELSPTQVLQLASSLNGLRNSGSGVNPLGVLQSAVGIDRLRIVSPDQNGGETGVAFGKYISRDVYVEIVTDARGQTASQIEISLTPVLSVFSQISAQGNSNVNVKFRKDY